MIGLPMDELYTTQARVIFLCLLSPILFIGVCGNLSVLAHIVMSNKVSTSMKVSYRYSVMSLALSDLLLLVTSGTITMSSLTHNLIVWKLPEWMCNVLPYLQTVAVLVGSLTLTSVAVDRYRVINPNYRVTRDQSRWWSCAVALVMIIWFVGFGASCPVLQLYHTEPVFIVDNTTYYRSALCIVDRSKAVSVYTALFLAIFLPLAVTFVFIHLLLALNIWKRKNIRSTRVDRNISDLQSNETSTVSTSNVRMKNDERCVKRPTPAHVVRTKRTVRMILILIIIFGVCRLPLWMFLILKLNVTLKGKIWWHVQVVLTSLSLLNASVNPFLYTFLSKTLSFVDCLTRWYNNNKRRRAGANRQATQVHMERRNSTKIPRGPYRF